MQIEGMPGSWVTCKLLGSNRVEVENRMTRLIHSIELVIKYPDGTQEIENFVKVESA